MFKQQVCLAFSLRAFLSKAHAENGWWRVYTVRVQVKQFLVSRAGCVGGHLSAHCPLPWCRAGQAVFMAKGINSCCGDPGKNCCTGKVNYQQKLWGRCSSKDNLQGSRSNFFPFRVKEKDLKYWCSVFVLSCGLALPFNCFSPFCVKENQDGLTFCFPTTSSQRRS